MLKGSYKRLPFVLKRNDEHTLVEQATDGIRKAISIGYYRPGEILPPMRVMAEMLGVSRIVTNAVVAQLAKEGMVDPRPRLGVMVLGRNSRVWRGCVQFVYRNNPGSFYPNFLASELRRRLIGEGYVFTQLAVVRNEAGHYDFSALDVATDKSVSLSLLMFNDPAIERRLSELGRPFAVIGKNACRREGCIGNIRLHREAVVSDFVLHCRVAVVKRVLQVGQIPADTQAVKALRGAGVEAEEWVIPPLDGIRPECVERAAMEAFDSRLAQGTGWLPDVLFFSDDYVARGAITALYEHGVRIPDDVRVVTWANRGNGPVMRLPFTRMEMDPISHGETIARCVVSYLKDGGFPEGVCVGPRYVVGLSFPEHTGTQNDCGSSGAGGKRQGTVKSTQSLKPVKSAKGLIRALVLAGIAWCMAVAGTAMARDYYVDSVGGSDSNDGLAPVRAFRTIAKATSVVGPGDIMHLAPGAPYYETLHIRGSGRAAAPIRVNGHGAVISGLKPIPDASWVALKNVLFLSANRECFGARRPRVVNSKGRMISVPYKLDPAKFEVDTLKPGEAFWNPKGIWYRAAKGDTPVGKGLCGTYRDSGVELLNQSYIEVENLVAEWYANDGFNVHGSCLGLAFRNIEARWCGDDGFSVHEDVQANVVNGWFHHCDDGIADICLSQTTYSGCLVESNRLYGVVFFGGLRVLFDTTVRDNDGEQIYVNRGGIEPKYNFDLNCPMFFGRVYLKKVQVIGGTGPAIRVSSGSDVTADHCLFSGNASGFRIFKGGVLHVFNSKIEGLRGEKLVADQGAKFVERP